jgi:hypothetical protein
MTDIITVAAAAYSGISRGVAIGVLITLRLADEWELRASPPPTNYRSRVQRYICTRTRTHTHTHTHAPLQRTITKTRKYARTRAHTVALYTSVYTYMHSTGVRRRRRRRVPVSPPKQKSRPRFP